MHIEQIYTGCLAQASYYIESDHEAIIIDPIRDSSIYINLLKQRNATLKYVLETHFHADFVSGHIELQRLTDCEIIFGPNAETAYDIIASKHEEKFSFGNLNIKVLHTPGHTLESVCYLLLSNDNRPHSVFTGDTLFIGEVGRPDLAVNSNMKSEDLAASLYDSLHNILMQLPDHVIVYPGHGAGSACGKNISSEKQSTIGDQKKFNYALQAMSKAEFVKLVLDGISPAPKYFQHDVSMNRDGYDSMSTVLKKSLQKLEFQDIQNAIKEDVVLLDVRMPDDFEKGFIPKSINIGKIGMFAPWVGNIVPPNSAILLICYPHEEREVILRLGRIGYHNIIGYTYGTADWQSKQGLIHNIETIHLTDEFLNQNTNIKVIDVRKEVELKLGFVHDSIHIPLSQLTANLDQISKSDDYLIYCAGGYRSMIACSLLKSKGYNRVRNIYGGFSEISKNIKHS